MFLSLEIFNVHDKDWLTYSDGTDRPDELCYNFSISNDLTQMVNFPTQVPDCDSHSPVLLDLFISSDASICSTMAFFPLENSDHIAATLSLNTTRVVAARQTNVLLLWRAILNCTS